MWRAVRRFSNTFTPHRTLEQDSSISMAIVKARDYKEIINAASSPNAKLGNITFGFRILSRFLKSDNTTKNVVKEEEFKQMIHTIRDNVDRLDSQGICDIFFWIRMSSSKSVSSFSRSDISSFTIRAEKLIEGSNYNSKQLINLYYDMAHINSYSPKVEAKIEEMINNRNEILNHVDYQTLLNSLAKFNRPSSRRISKAAIDRICTSNYSNTDISILSNYLSSIPYQFKRFQINPKIAEFVDKLKQLLFDSLNHIAPNEAKTIIEFYEKFPKQDTLLFEECINKQFSLLKTNPNIFNNSYLKFLAGFIISINRSSLPFSCPPDMKYILKDLIIDKIKNRKNTEFIYELVCALGMLGIRLNPEEQKKVLGSFLPMDQRGLYPFHFSRMLFRAGIEDVEFLFKVIFIIGL